MEGTRLTLVKVPDQRDGFEFSIRTPVTPARWDQFEKDLQSAWETYMEALQTGSLLSLTPLSIAEMSSQGRSMKLLDLF